MLFLVTGVLVLTLTRDMMLSLMLFMVPLNAPLNVVVMTL